MAPAEASSNLALLTCASAIAPSTTDLRDMYAIVAQRGLRRRVRRILTGAYVLLSTATTTPTT